MKWCVKIQKKSTGHEDPRGSMGKSIYTYMCSSSLQIKRPLGLSVLVSLSVAAVSVYLAFVSAKRDHRLPSGQYSYNDAC